MEACVPVGGIGAVQLIAGTDPGWITPLRYLLHELQVVVTRNAEEVLDSSLVQPPEHEITDGLFHGRIFLVSRNQCQSQSGLHSLVNACAEETLTAVGLQILCRGGRVVAID